MFQLIVSVVAIALTSALALASLSYGGSIMSGSMVKANVATLINDGQQINNAVILDGLDNPFQAVSMDRIPSIPMPPKSAAAGATWQIDPSGIAYIRLSQTAAPKVCAEVQQMGGVDNSVAWSDASSAALALRASGRMFGCIGNDTANYFAYKIG